jgi:hypothetical protein
MQTEFSTIIAEFNSGNLVVTDTGPDFPQPFRNEGLISRLNRLAENGWEATSVVLQGNKFIVSIERRELTPKTVTRYSILMYHTTQHQSESLTGSYEKQYFRASVKYWIKIGWSELKTVNLLIPEHDEWMVSLLMKEGPQSTYPRRHD